MKTPRPMRAQGRTHQKIDRKKLKTQHTIPPSNNTTPARAAIFQPVLRPQKISCAFSDPCCANSVAESAMAEPASLIPSFTTSVTALDLSACVASVPSCWDEIRWASNSPKHATSTARENLKKSDDAFMFLYITNYTQDRSLQSIFWNMVCVYDNVNNDCKGFQLCEVYRSERWVYKWLYRTVYVSTNTTMMMRLKYFMFLY